MPRRALLVSDGAGMVDTAALKGVHPQHQVGDPGRGGDLSQPQERRIPAVLREDGGRAVLDRPGAIPGAERPAGVPEGIPHRQPARRSRDHVQGQGPARPADMASPIDAEPMFVGKTAENYPKPDGKYIFDKLSSVYISGNATPATTPRTTSGSDKARPPRRSPKTWPVDVPGGRLRDPPMTRLSEGPVDVIVNYPRTACSAARSPPRAAG